MAGCWQCWHSQHHSAISTRKGSKYVQLTQSMSTCFALYTCWHVVCETQIFGYIYITYNKQYKPEILLFRDSSPQRTSLTIQWCRGEVMTEITQIIPNPSKSHVVGHIMYWLVVDLLFWKIWVRQLGWWNSQYMEKQNHVPSHQNQCNILTYVWNKKIWW